MITQDAFDQTKLMTLGIGDTFAPDGEEDRERANRFGGDRATRVVQ